MSKFKVGDRVIAAITFEVSPAFRGKLGTISMDLGCNRYQVRWDIAGLALGLQHRPWAADYLELPCPCGRARSSCGENDHLFWPERVSGDDLADAQVARAEELLQRADERIAELIREKSELELSIEVQTEQVVDLAADRAIARQKIDDLTIQRDTLGTVLNYATSLLPKGKQQRVQGYWDGAREPARRQLPRRTTLRGR